MERNFSIHEWQAKYLKENSDEKVQKLVRYILSPTDGPVDDFNAIYTALEMAVQKQASVRDLADALYESLEVLKQSGGRISSNEY